MGKVAKAVAATAAVTAAAVVQSAVEAATSTTTTTERIKHPVSARPSDEQHSTLLLHETHCQRDQQLDLHQAQHREWEESINCLDRRTGLLSLRGGSISSNTNSDTTTTSASSSATSSKSSKLKQQKDTKSSSSSSSSSTTTNNKAGKDKSSRSGSSSKKKASSSSSSSSSSSNRIVNEIMKETDYYKILGLDKNEILSSSSSRSSSDIETIIQKAYRKRAVQTHPDKTNGDRRAFDKVAEAYDVLSDSNKRTIYNKYGKRGLDSTANMSGGTGASGFSAATGMAPEDIFRSFFGGTSAGAFGSNPFGSQQQQHQRHTNRSMRFEVDVTLEDIYAGRTMRVMIPGSNKPIDLSIPRGSYHNEQIVVSGVIETNPQSPPGDAYFRIKVRPHNIYTNKGYDLAIQLDISFAEAITGVSRSIRHLDGRTIHIISAPAGGTATTTKTSTSSDNIDPNSIPTIITTGDVHVIKGEGMPKNAMGTEYGDLYVQYQVNMPETTRTKGHGTDHNRLTETERKELERLLYKLEGKDITTKSTKKGKQHHSWPYKSLHTDGKIMKTAKASDFGKNQPIQTNDGSENDPSSSSSFPSFEPFGSSSGFTSSNGGRSYFWSSSTAGGNPFGQHVPPDDDPAQCRQM